MPKTRPLRFILTLFALIAFGSGGLILLGGAAAFPGIDMVDASADSEMRFFAAYWLGYGAMCVWITRDIGARIAFVPALASVLAVGIFGRILSYITIGQPHSMLVNGLIVEIVNLVLLLFAYQYAQRAHQ